MAASPDPFPYNEQERIDTLYSYQVLDTSPENNFEHIVQLAVDLFDVPIAFISFIDDERTWFKASKGISVYEMPKATGLCTHTILTNDPFIVTNALEHEVARENALVTGPMGLRFYAAIPLTVRNGYRIGTLCIADTTPRDMSEKQISLLQLLGTMTSEQLELRKQAGLQLFRQQDIMAHLSHELKNSISLVIGYAALLKDTEPGDENFPQFCDIILKAGNRMAKLSEEALVMASNRSPVFEVTKTSVALTPLIKECVSGFLLRAKEKGQRINVNIGVDVHIKGDAQKINEIVENLLSNAIKYTPFQKDVYIILQLSQPNAVLLTVKDEGPGLTPFDLLKLFQPFTRLSARPTGDESSTGMGLYIAQKLVEMHGGKIWAANSENGGAEFYVEFPCETSS